MLKFTDHKTKTDMVSIGYDLGSSQARLRGAYYRDNIITANFVRFAQHRGHEFTFQDDNAMSHRLHVIHNHRLRQRSTLYLAWQCV